MFDIDLANLTLLDWVSNALVVITTLAAVWFFNRPMVKNSKTWRATVTPIASIIGSGLSDHCATAWFHGWTLGRARRHGHRAAGMAGG